MNSYQKIKAKNKQLERDIRILALQPDTLDAIKIKMGYIVERDIDNQCFAGSGVKE